MSFHPDISKQADEVIFSRKRSVSSHSPLTFNNTPVAQANSLKHLAMQLDKKLNFEEIAKLESLQYNATLAITGSIKGSSTEKIYEELGLESL